MKDNRGGVLIIVMWVSFGLVSIALYFAQSMSLELKGADHRAAAIAAGQATEGAARYVAYLLSHVPKPGQPPDAATMIQEAVPVGDAVFWLIGRTNLQYAPPDPVFGLVDEASKLNLNTATRQMLEALPRMTPELAAAIIDWRDSDSEVTTNGAEDETYLRRSPPYKCKNAPFESVDELGLVFGADSEILYGEDRNLNGVLDPNENDGDASLPLDNRDGRLDPGVLDFVTVHSSEPNTDTNGTPRIIVTGAGVAQRVAPVLQQALGATRANEILRQLAGPGPGFRSVLEFYIRSRMTAEEFATIADGLTAANGQAVAGLINVNTASEEVLRCIPGIGTDKAAAVVAYRQSNPGKLGSVAWLAEVLGNAEAIQAGPYVTSRSYQFSADVAAVGPYGRGYRRTRFIFDTSDGTPRMVSRQDLSQLGWALGRRVRLQQFTLARGIR